MESFCLKLFEIGCSFSCGEGEGLFQIVRRQRQSGFYRGSPIHEH